MEISFPSPPPPPPPPPPSPPLRCPSARRNVSPTAASIRPVADHVRSLVSVAALAVALRGLPLALPSASVLSHAFFLRRRFSGDYRLHLKEEDPKSGEEDDGQICWEFVVSFSLEKNPPIHVPPLSHSQLPPSHRRLSPTIILRVRLREIKVCPFSHDISIYGQRYLDRGRAVAAWGCRRWLDGVRVRHGRLRRAATAYIAFYDYSVICSCRDRDGRTGGLTGAGGRARTVGRSGARPSP